MVQKNPFLKYLIKDKKEDIFHTSGYAKAQNGANMGAASTESYQVRVNVNQNRQKIQGYNRSRLVTGAMANAPKPKTYEAPKVGETTARAAIPVKKSGISIKR